MQKKFLPLKIKVFELIFCMTSEKIKNRFQAAQVLIREAGILANEWFRNRSVLIVEKKGEHDWVSKADHEVEIFIKKKIESMFPEDGFLGEELGFIDQKKIRHLGC